MTNALLRASAICAVAAAPAAFGGVLYEDVMYWLPGGQTVINPSSPPLNAYLKIQETVYDNDQGKQILNQQLAIGAINGSAVPGVPINLYAYSITNLNYGNGPFTGVGAGVSGFDISAAIVLKLGIWAPNFANSRWEPDAGNWAPMDYDWDIDVNGNGRNGDGFGILLGQTFDSFTVAVPDGTPHGLVNAQAYTWSGGGALEQPISGPADMVFGVVSGPVPSPGVAALLGLGFLTRARRRA